MFFLLVLAGTDKASADFKPALTLTLTNTQPETPGDFKIDFGIRDPKDVNFGGVVSFIPPDWGIVRGDKIPIGEPVGKLDAAATLGLINSPCNQQLAVHFDFVNATLDKSSTVSFKDLEADAGGGGRQLQPLESEKPLERALEREHRARQARPVPRHGHRRYPLPRTTDLVSV